MAGGMTVFFQMIFWSPCDMRGRYGVTVCFVFCLCDCCCFLFVVCSMFQAEHAFNTMNGDTTLIAIYSVGTVSSSH